MSNNDKKELVIYDNKMNTFGLRSFNASELDIWWAIVSKIKDIGTKEIFISREELIYHANYDINHRTIKGFEKDMHIVYDKVKRLDVKFRKEDGELILFVPFKLGISTEGLKIIVDEYFEPWFNSFNQYTRFELQNIVHLKSGYTKEFYRFLMQWQENYIVKGKPECFWSVSIDEFRRVMCIPDSYRIPDIERQILNKAKEDLLLANENGVIPIKELSWKKIKRKGSKKVTSLLFTFIPTKPRSKKDREKEVDTPELTPEEQQSKAEFFEHNYTRGYIQGQSLTAKEFVTYLKENNFNIEIDKDYFRVRKSAYKSIETQYKSFVEEKVLSELEYLAVIINIITKGEPVLDYTVEQESYNLIKRKSKIPYKFLSHQQRKEINEILELNID